jgi:hypothetical protein
VTDKPVGVTWNSPVTSSAVATEVDLKPRTVVSTTNLPDDCAGSMTKWLTSDGGCVAEGGVAVGTVEGAVVLEDEVEVVV